MIVVEKFKVYAHTSMRVQSMRLKLKCKLAGWSGYSACLILIHLPAAALGMHLETAGDDFDLSSFVFLFI